MEITYLTQPPKRYTFEQPKLREWVEKQCRGKVLNLFAGRTKLNVDEYRVDFDKEVPADFYGDAFEFVSTTEMRFDTIILDPPWSIRKSREKYGGRVVGSFTKIKNVLRRILNKGGRVITVGYSSTGMSKSRGFEKIALAVVCHNGDHDDSFAITEEDYEKDIEVIVEEQIKVKSKQELIDTDPNRSVKCQKCKNITKKQIYLVNNKFICIDCYLNSKLKKGKNKKCSQKKQQ
jgi:hypothetical protein